LGCVALICVRLYYVWLDSLKLGTLFKIPLARGSDPYIMSLFTKFTSPVVVVRSWVRFSKLHSRVVVIR